MTNNTNMTNEGIVAPVDAPGNDSVALLNDQLIDVSPRGNRLLTAVVDPDTGLTDDEIRNLMGNQAVPHLRAMQLLVVHGDHDNAEAGARATSLRTLPDHLTEEVKKGRIPAALDLDVSTTCLTTLMKSLKAYFVALPAATWGSGVKTGEDFVVLERKKQASQWTPFGVHCYHLARHYLRANRQGPYNTIGRNN